MELSNNKKMILGVGAFLIIIAGALLINENGENQNTDNQTQSINTSIPFDDDKSIFSDKEDAYKSEIEKNEERRRKEENLNNQFGSINTEGLSGGKLTTEEKVDSLLRANAIDNQTESNNNRRKKNSGKNYSGGSFSHNKSYSSGNYSDNGKVTGSGKTNYDKWNADKQKSELKGFFSSAPADDEAANKYDKIIYAVIYGDKNTPEGGRVAIRLTNDALINGKKYKRNTMMYGFAKFGKNRVYLQIKKINQDFVNLDVYDSQDGLKGIYTEENLIAETASETSDDVNVKGIPVEKIGKKIIRSAKKNKKVMLFNGYKIFLKKSEK